RVAAEAVGAHSNSGAFAAAGLHAVRNSIARARLRLARRARAIGGAVSVRRTVAVRSATGAARNETVARERSARGRSRRSGAEDRAVPVGRSSGRDGARVALTVARSIAAHAVGALPGRAIRRRRAGVAVRVAVAEHVRRTDARAAR